MYGWPIGGGGAAPGGAIGGGPMRGWPIGGGGAIGGGLIRGWPIDCCGAGGAAAAPIFAPHCGQNDPWACAPQLVQKAMV
jgi:hypothetical protein